MYMLNKFFEEADACGLMVDLNKPLSIQETLIISAFAAVGVFAVGEYCRKKVEKYHTKWYLQKYRK